MAVAANRSVDLNHLHPIKERNQYDPCIVVIFGGAGDLSHRKLIPALYNLFIDGELPDKFAILGFSTTTRVNGCPFSCGWIRPAAVNPSEQVSMNAGGIAK